MRLNKRSQSIYTIDSFVSAYKCDLFIQLAEQQGFKPADVDLGSSRKVLTNIRNNERVDHYSESLAREWWSKLEEFELPQIDDLRSVGLSPYFRFYKYQPGQKFNMHKDGRQSIGSDITRFSLLVYLNEGYSGGETQFRQEDLMIKPITGMALLFEHDLWHQGVEITKGIKYVLRTDVVYR